MSGTALNPFQRLALAFYAFFAILFRLDVALAVRAIREQRRAGLLAEPPVPPSSSPPREEEERGEGASEGVSRRIALQLLSVLQREGRLVDFIEEDLTGYSDAAVGAAARTVHDGCKRAILELFRLEPVLRQPEGAMVEVAAGFDPGAVRLTGNVVGSPPFRGNLRHHGWRAQDVLLPPPPDGMDPAIVAPAEVEL